MTTEPNRATPLPPDPDRRDEAPADRQPLGRPASAPPGPADTEGAPVDEIDLDGDGARRL